MALSVKRKIQAGFAVALGFLLLTGATAWWSARRNAETFRAVDHTYQVLDQLEDMLVEMLNAETGSRGFAISGDETSLQTYQAGITAVHKSFATAKQLTQDNPNQQQRLAVLEPLIQKKITLAGEVIALRRSGQTEQALQSMASGAGQQAMDEIRRLIGEMELEENHLLQQRTAKAQGLSRVTIAIGVFGSLLAFGLVGLASTIVCRDFEKRRQAEEERDRFFTLSLDMLCIANSDGYFKRVNPAFTATLGWSQEEMLTRPFMEFVHPDDRQATLAEVEKQVVRGEKVLRFVNRYQHKDGSWRWISWNSVPQSGGFMYATARDITELRRAEEALRRSEESLAVTLQSIGDAVLATDTQGRVTRLNPVAEKLTGWTQAEAAGRPIAEIFCIVNEETRGPSIIPVEKVLATGEIHGLANHTVLIARDGTERPIADSAAPIRDKDGRTIGVVLVFRDVSEEHQAQQRLREKEEDLIAVLKASPEAIGVVNTKTSLFESPNPQTERLFGLSRAELEKVGPAQMSPEFQTDGRQSCDAARVKINAALRGDQPVFEWMHRNVQGDLIPCEVRLVALPPPREHLVRFSITDMTDRKRAEEEIRRFNMGLEELVQQRTAEMRQALATLDATEEGAFIFDPETLRHSYVNEGAVRQLGYSREELLTMTPVSFKTELNEAGYRKLLAPMLRGESRTHRFTALHRQKDGHDLPVEINLQYVTPVGERPRFIAIVRDITERQKHERLALRSQRLEAIGTLAGGVAHDLNNALAPILMGVEMLKMQYPEESKIIDVFQSSAKRGADMVRQLLAFAKGAEGERISIQPGRLFKEMQNLIKGSFPKNIQLAVKCDSKLPTILGDATQLHQILLNLCVNARDAMPHGGTLRLEAHSIEVDAAFANSIPDAKPGNYVVLRVRDTGMGIPPEILDRIFEPFFTTKGPDKGTGLGLSTVVGIVKGHGGFLQVYSQVGQGSTFAVYLPADRPGNETEIVTKASAEFRGQSETILLVDDEPAVREVARAVLRRLNFTPLTAIDGADGLVQAAEHRTELRAIITDMHMPHMDGLAFVRALRRVLPNIPIAVASGRMEDSVAGEFKILGVTHRIDKPFTEAQLANELKSLLTPQ